MWGQPFQIPTAIVTAGIAAGAYAGTVWVRGRASGPRIDAAARWVFVVCATALLLEVSLAALRPTPILSTSLRDVTERIASFSFRPGEIRFGVPVNESGFYDEPFVPAAARTRPAVALLGDSFGVGIVPLAQHYSTVAERAIGDVDVYSVGVRGLGPAGYLHVLRTEVLRLEPDAVVVAVFAGNDLLDIPMSRRSTKWMRRLFDRDQLLVRVVPTRIRTVRRERRARGRDEGDQVDRKASLQPWFDDYTLEVRPFSQEAYDEIVRERAQVLCLPHPRRLAVLQGALERMRELVGAAPFLAELVR